MLFILTQLGPYFESRRLPFQFSRQCFCCQSCLQYRSEKVSFHLFSTSRYVKLGELGHDEWCIVGLFSRVNAWHCYLIIVNSLWFMGGHNLQKSCSVLSANFILHHSFYFQANHLLSTTLWTFNKFELSLLMLVSNKTATFNQFDWKW